MAAFAAYAPTMVGGAADLVESTKTVFEGAGQFSRVHTGRNVPFGIREHGMGAIVNGAAAHGGIVKPYGSTFLVFSDYMRGSVRLSALMGLPVVWVWTHDSVGLGEDGPTHQPVEHYTALRAIPHLWVVRPADANETVQAWRVALEREDGPVALLLSRQGIPVLDREDGKLAAASELERGGYVLWDSAPSPEVILISTGAEVPTTLEAARALAAQGTAVRVVSMPCVELFEAQTQEYRDTVLPPAVAARLAVEPGATVGWWKWVGTHGDVLGIDRFGASAPGARVLAGVGLHRREHRRPRPRAAPVVGGARARALLRPDRGQLRGAGRGVDAQPVSRRSSGRAAETTWYRSRLKRPPSETAHPQRSHRCQRTPRQPPPCTASPRWGRACGWTSSRASRFAAGTCRS